MLNPYRLKALEGLLDYLSGMQGNDLKSLMGGDGEKPMMEGSPEEEAMESPKEEMVEDSKTGMGDKMDMGKPKGIALEKVSILGKPKEEMDVGKGPMDKSDQGMQQQPSDDELEELFSKFRR